MHLFGSVRGRSCGRCSRAAAYRVYPCRRFGELLFLLPLLSVALFTITIK